MHYGSFMDKCVQQTVWSSDTVRILPAALLTLLALLMLLALLALIRAGRDYESHTIRKLTQCGDGWCVHLKQDRRCLMVKSLLCPVGYPASDHQGASNCVWMAAVFIIFLMFHSLLSASLSSSSRFPINPAVLALIRRCERLYLLPAL